MSTAYVIELTFKVVMILASIGLVIATLKKGWQIFRKYLFYVKDLNDRLTALESKNKKRKPKGKTKRNEKTK